MTFATCKIYQVFLHTLLKAWDKNGLLQIFDDCNHFDAYTGVDTLLRFVKLKNFFVIKIEYFIYLINSWPNRCNISRCWRFSWKYFEISMASVGATGLSSLVWWYNYIQQVDSISSALHWVSHRFMNTFTSSNLISSFNFSGKDLNSLSVRVGSSFHGVFGNVVNISRVVDHPKYSAHTFDYDVSLIQLSETLHFDEKVQPIALPDANTEIADGTVCMATGWGKLFIIITLRSSKYQK